MKEVKLTKSNFREEVINSDIPVLVDFWAPWCGPCKMISPVISELAIDYAGKIKIGKVNVDEEMDIANEYQIASIPTLILFKGGKVEKRSSGFMPKEDIERMMIEV